jgi:hypothetical protein
MQPKEPLDAPTSNTKPSKPQRQEEIPGVPQDSVDELTGLLKRMSPEQLRMVFSNVFPQSTAQVPSAQVSQATPKVNPIIQAAPLKYPDIQQPAAVNGAVFDLPPADKIHWTALYPDAAAIDPMTGAPRLPRPKAGAQFSARQIDVENLYTKQCRKIVVNLWQNPRDWPILKCEKVVKNIEVVFDHEDERDEFLRAFGSARHDPLALNDQVGSAFDIKEGRTTPPNGRIAPPPGGYDLYSNTK